MKVFYIVMGVVTVGLLVQLAPDLLRYIKLRSM
jgi:hypothetical protein